MTPSGDEATQGPAYENPKARERCPIEWGRMSWAAFPDSSKMFQNLPEWSGAFWNALECSQVF